ncbi:MAG: sulfatase-like hydrolase/transferase [Armatimonadota bacterium]
MPAPSARPNIIILNTDQQRFDTIAAAGNGVMHTPNLDRLAESGALLERFYVQAPVCMPSRASMMSGQYPNSTGVTCNGPRMPEDVRCIQHMLGDAGYFTGVIGKLHFLPHSARDHRDPHPPYGFDHLQICDEPGCYRDAYREWVREQDPSQLDAINCGLPPARARWEQMMGWEGTVRPPVAREGFEPQIFEGPDDLTNASFVADRSVQFLRERGRRPFFLWAGFYHPHSPLIPPQSCVDLYDPDEIPLPAGGPRATTPDGARELADDELREIRRAYYAMVSDVDRHVGRVLDAIDDLGLRENTIVVFTSDHGEYIGEHGKFGKGTPGYNCIMHVPCLISYPGRIEPGIRVSGMMEAVDIAPTLLEYAGVVREPSLQGRSMCNLIAGDDAAARESVYGEYASPGRTNWAMARTAEWFYAYDALGGEVLFDVPNDPDELHNVAHESDFAAPLCEMRELALKRSLDARPDARLEARY